MIRKKSKFYSKFVLLWAVIFTALGLALLYLPKNLNYVYNPYIASELAIVFDDQKLGQEAQSNLDFLLSDLKKLDPKTTLVALNSYDQSQAAKDLVKAGNYVYIDLFTSKDPESLNEGYFNNQFDFQNPFALKLFFTDRNNLLIVYDREQKLLKFVSPKQSLLINQKSYLMPDFTVHEVNDLAPTSLIKIGNLVFDLNGYKNDLSVSIRNLISNPIVVYQLEADNLLSGQNFSFESGLWQKEAYDCSNHLSGEPQFFLLESADFSEGSKSLELGSANHFACIFKIFDLKTAKDKLYKFSFDYKNLSGHKAQFYYNLRDKDNRNQDYSEVIEIYDNAWHTKEAIIDPKNESQFLEVYLYSPSDGSGNVTNLYDNLKMKAFSPSREISPAKLDFPQSYILQDELALLSGENTFTYESDKINLLENYNSSFEGGLWTKEVIDCSNYLFGEAKLDMSISEDASLGRQSLNLKSQNHFACTYKSFPVKIYNDKLYQLSFDYKNLSGNKVQYFYNFKDETGREQNLLEVIEAETGKWQTYRTIINPSIGNAASFDLYFYAPSGGSEDINTIFDNVRLEELAPKNIYSYYLYQKQASADLGKQARVRLLGTNYWQNDLVIEDLSRPVLLVYPKTYSKNWQIFSASQKFLGLVAISQPLPENWHYLANNNFNAWYLDPEYCLKQGFCEVDASGSLIAKLSIQHRFSTYIYWLIALSWLAAIITMISLMIRLWLKK